MLRPLGFPPSFLLSMACLAAIASRVRSQSAAAGSTAYAALLDPTFRPCAAGLTLCRASGSASHGTAVHSSREVFCDADPSCAGAQTSDAIACPSRYTHCTASRMADNCDDDADFCDIDRDCWGDRDHCCPDGAWSCGEQSYSCVIAAFADPSASAVDTRDYDCNRPEPEPERYDEWGHQWVKVGRALQLTTVLVGLLVYFVGSLVAMCYFGPQQNGFTHPLHELGCHALVEVCCVSYWCPCLAWARVAKYNESLREHGEELLCCMYCGVAVCTGCQCVLGIFTRESLRRRRQIPGNFLGDCCIHAFAHSCALCQEYADIRVIESGAVSLPPPAAVLSHNPVVPLQPMTIVVQQPPRAGVVVAQPVNDGQPVLASAVLDPDDPWSTGGKPIATSARAHP